MTIQEIKKSNRKLKAMEKRNGKKLEKIDNIPVFHNIDEAKKALDNFFGFGGKK